MSKDSEFIKRPLTEILEKVSWEISCLDAGFTTEYVLRYILDSAFLQITGALEQKAKCVYWELGNNNHELRYDILKDKIGECSNYKEKNNIFRAVAEEIITIKNNKINVHIEQKKYWNVLDKLIEKFYNNKVLSECFQRQYQEYINIKMYNLLIDNSNIDKKDNFHLLNNKEELRKIYDKAIEYRNRIAHNTKSTLNNIPDFAILRNENYKYENLFARFAIILLVDRTFIDIFEQYEKAIYD